MRGYLEVLAPIFLIPCILTLILSPIFEGIHRIVFGHHRLLSKRFPFAIYYKILGAAIFGHAARGSSWSRISGESESSVP